MLYDNDDDMLSKVENLLNGAELKKNKKRSLLNEALVSQKQRFEKELVNSVLSQNDIFATIELRNTLLQQVAEAEKKIAEDVASAVYSAIDSKEGKSLSGMLSAAQYLPLDRRFIAADVHSIVRHSSTKKMTEKALLGTHFI
jgi:F0F1-type ATP synthase delta subunit